MLSARRPSAAPIARAPVPASPAPPDPSAINGGNHLATGGLGGSNPYAGRTESGRAYNNGAQAYGPTRGAAPNGFMVNNPQMNGGVQTGGPTPGMNAVQQAQSQGPSLEDIQAEQRRMGVGAQLNSNPQNSALAGYMMG